MAFVSLAAGGVYPFSVYFFSPYQCVSFDFFFLSNYPVFIPVNNCTGAGARSVRTVILATPRREKETKRTVLE